MTIDVIKDIKEVEQQAEQILKQAHNTVRQKMEETRAESERLISKASADSQKEIDDIIKKAESRAEEEISKIKIQISMECAEIKDAARKKFPEAIDIIAGRVVKFNVNS